MPYFSLIFPQVELIVYSDASIQCSREPNAIHSFIAVIHSFVCDLQAMAREHKGKLALDSLLIMPVQRIPRYELLIKVHTRLSLRNLSPTENRSSIRSKEFFFFFFLITNSPSNLCRAVIYSTSLRCNRFYITGGWFLNQNQPTLHFSPILPIRNA